MRFDTLELAGALGAAHRGAPTSIDGAGIDSRTIVPGALFVPIVAARDGHDFIEAALRSGAGAYLTEESQPVDRDAAALVVDDCSDALTSLGALARRRVEGPVVGITGSVGKTSAKDMARAVLATARRVTASERSFNNELGVPLTLICAPDDVEVVVVEMGARGIGHIAELCGVARPTIGVVTTVAMAHTETFGSVEAIAAAKAELVAHLPAEGTAILNASVPAVAAMASQTDAEVLRFGTGGDVVAEELVLDGDLRPRFVLRSPWGSVDVALDAHGAHQVDNALAAAAIGLTCGLDPHEVAGGLGDVALSPSRMAVARAAAGGVVIDDAYNANPTSMAAALRALAALPADRRVAVLGEMAELGPDADVAHEAVSALAEDLGIEVVAVGAPAYRARDVDDVDAAMAHVGAVGAGVAVLVKGSRVAGLEVLAARLRDA